MQSGLWFGIVKQDQCCKHPGARHPGAHSMAQKYSSLISGPSPSLKASFSLKGSIITLLTAAKNYSSSILLELLIGRQLLCHQTASSTYEHSIWPVQKSKFWQLEFCSCLMYLEDKCGPHINTRHRKKALATLQAAALPRKILSVSWKNTQRYHHGQPSARP